MPSAGAAAIVAELDRLAGELVAELGGLATEQEIRAAQARYLGKKGRLAELMKALGRLPAQDRPVVGEAANRAKGSIEAAVGARLAALAEAVLGADLARVLDVTLPGRGPRLGTLHPLTLVRREIEQIFLGLGFEVRTGPWIETEWNNFDALNTPADHPARDMQDTFFVEGGRILRSHTSPVQIRTMLAGPPPVRIVAPGNVFRRDDDATHTPMFPQLECLLVDEGVSFADLKGTLLHFVQRFFGPKLGVRLRPSYFPFTEPSAEVDAACYLCEGSGLALAGVSKSPEAVGRACKLCKGSGWIEIGGSGMVHPNVFKAVGYDPKVVSGFAFGMGLSRMAMLKYGVDDLRAFYENDTRFLAQFR
ncbi:MAG TPA: phenylalanine--tRNA ligase subunit alpha [Polyangia bacterium]|jgi:phenylalanyl-tRNA synthetase alpha chain|nr:phenylalanine--tRNA ligase subunit alpha [Polyangia bacterium]